MRRWKGAHSGENIAEAIAPVLLEMGIMPKLGYFIADNDARNDTCIRAILRKHRPDIKDPGSRRVRCLGHIINLAAKAFLFGKDADAFEDSTDTACRNGHLEALREEWRKQGPVGKFHNTIKFIRMTPQRREAFAALLKDELPANIAGALTWRPVRDLLNTNIYFFSSNGHLRQRNSMEFYLFVYGTRYNRRIEDQSLFRRLQA